MLNLFSVFAVISFYQCMEQIAVEVWHMALGPPARDATVPPRSRRGAKHPQGRGGASHL